MWFLLLRKLGSLVPTVLIATFVVFALQALIPGGPASALAGPDAAPEAVAAIEERLHLDDPFLLRYLRWLGDAVQGDLGRSYLTQQPVSELIGQRLEPTLELTIGALLVSIVVGGALGMWSAIRARHRDGRIVSALSGIGLAMPNFWVAAISAGFFGLYLGILPVGGYVPLGAGLYENVRSLTLAVLVMAVHSAVLIGLQLRSAMSATLDSTHVRTARAVGLRPREVYFNFALRAALPPVITYLPLIFAALVGSSVVVESVFSIPGLGLATSQAIDNRDYPTLQGIVLVLVLAVVVLNILADVALVIIDPRLRRRMGVQA